MRGYVRNMSKLEKDGLKLARMIVDKADLMRHMFGESGCPDDEIEILARQIVKQNERSIKKGD